MSGRNCMNFDFFIKNIKVKYNGNFVIKLIIYMTYVN